MTTTLHLDSEQIRQQLRATELQRDLLERQYRNPDLPLMVWSIPAAGCVLSGQPMQRTDVQACLEAWADALNLAAVEKIVTPGGIVRFKAMGRVYVAEDKQVQVVLTADDLDAT